MAVLFGTAWAAYGMLGGGTVMLVILVIAQMLVCGVLAVLPTSQK